MKPLIYQVLPRLFGNLKGKNVVNGSISQNGCGKMSYFSDENLERIKDFGYTHIWLTGMLAHASATDYTRYGIPKDNPDVVKGKAGSPYAIRDYYDIDPDLALNPAERMKEFEALLKRCHAAGLKVVLDFVPNHVARGYRSTTKPEGVRDLGQDDRTDVFFDPDNNFYYLPGETLHTENFLQGRASDYLERPARATGNDCFHAYPSQNDWYETVKLNYGVDYSTCRTRFFPTVEEQEMKPDCAVPDTWKKMTDILLYWSAKGIDAFRCDMAEMVPVEFWHYATKRVKAAHPELLFIAEVYNPAEYRNYIYQGGFDYLYNKVGLYDTLKQVVRQEQSAAALTGEWQHIDDIRDHMLNFLENHDEQRIASPFFAGESMKALPAFIVSALMDKSAVMLYAGQELGEKGMDGEGFSGCDGRTTIFDYWTVDAYRKWAEGESEFNEDEAKLYNAYRNIMQLCRDNEIVREGNFYDLMYVNYDHRESFNPDRQYAFIRSYRKQALLIVVNFDESPRNVSLKVPAHAFEFLQIKAGQKNALDVLSNTRQRFNLQPDELFNIQLPAYGAAVLKI